MHLARLREEVCPLGRTHPPHPHSHRGEALRLPSVQQALHAQRPPEEARPPPPQLQAPHVEAQPGHACRFLAESGVEAEVPRFKLPRNPQPWAVGSMFQGRNSHFHRWVMWPLFNIVWKSLCTQGLGIQAPHLSLDLLKPSSPSCVWITASLPKVDWELNSFLYIRFFPKSIKKYKYNNTILAISVPYKVASVFVSLKANPLAYSWFFYIYIYFQPNMHQVGSVASHRQRLHPSCPAGLWAVTKLNLLIPSEQLNSQSSCSARQLKMFTLCLWIIGHYCSREMKPELIPTASFPNYAS